jgi:hypothetical protein
MAITLDSTLNAHLDSTDSRKPLVSLISSEGGSEIPFSGNEFKTDPSASTKPYIISHSNGRLYTAYEAWNFYMFYTDEAREEWSEIMIADPGQYHSALEIAMCELDDGNIGVVWTEDYWITDDLELWYKIIDEDGNTTKSATKFDTITNNSNEWWYHPAVINMSNGTQMLVISRVDLTADPEETVLYKYTATNFQNWSSATALSIGGLDSPLREIQSVSLIEDNNNNILLWFDYVDDVNTEGNKLWNVYYSVSGDFGSTWGSATQVSDYDNYSEVGTHPEAAQRANDNMVLVFTKLLGSQSINSGSDGWPAGWGSWCSIGKILGSIEHVEYDAANDRLLIRCVSGYLGDKAMCAIVIVDVPTWSVYRSYTGVSTPGFHPIFGDSHVYWNKYNIDPPYIPFAVNGDLYSGVVDYISDTVTHYYFKDNVGQSIVQNVVPPPGNIAGAWVEAAEDRMYYLFTGGGTLTVGYIDLTESPDPVDGYYSFHTIVSDSNYSSGFPATLQGSTYHFSVWPSANFIIVSSKQGYDNGWSGGLWIYTLDTGASFKKYHSGTHSGFHRYGCGPHVYQDGKIYASIAYTSGWQQQDRRGMVEVDFFTDTFYYRRPSHAYYDSYGISQMKPIGNNEIIMASNMSTDGGIYIYNTSDQTWKVYNRTRSGDDTSIGIGGFDPSGTGQYTHDRMFTVAYDPATGRIFSGRIYSGDQCYSCAYALMFSRYGTLRQPYYVDGIYSAGSWSFDWDNRSLWAQGYYNDVSDIAALDGSIWTAWEQNETSESEYLQWDREGEVLDLSDLVPAGTEVSVRWALEEPDSLTFQLAKGHLFDQHNLSSVYYPLLKKGRTITLKFGEEIGGLPYWVNMGDFYVHETSLSMAKGEDPILDVLCYDKTILWPEMLITATKYFDGKTPNDLLEQLGETYLNLGVGEMDFPDPFDGSHVMYHQWIDMPFKDIVDEICHHFGYVPKFNKEGNLTAIQVYSTSGMSVDNTYPDSTLTVQYTPDDTFSNYVNRITVIGETHDFFEVVYTEERILFDHGTVGFWDEEEVKTYYYSDDRERRCIQPKLANVHQPEQLNLFWSVSGDMGITYEDPYNYYVEVTIENPDWEDAILPIIIELAVTAVVCMYCDALSSIPVIGTITGGCGICMMLITLMIVQILQFLSSQANWSFELFAKPLGQEKQTVQFTVDDAEFQQKLGGIIVEEKIEDALCYSEQVCEQVARYEMMVVQLQRKRLTFTKLVHLQDELGDVIQVNHPYTNDPITIFVTALTRRYMQGHPGEDEGYFLDDIEGWRV